MISLGAARTRVGRLEVEADRRTDLAGRRLRIAAARVANSYPEYAEDPVGFVRDVLGEDRGVEDVLEGRAPSANAPWEKQAAILEAVRDHKRVVVRASHSVGKTHIAARVGLWFLYTRAPSVVLTTAPKFAQVRDLLWARWRSSWSQARRPLSGTCLTTRCDPEPGDPEWHAMGHTARDAESISGYHEVHTLLIFDEAPGVPAHIWTAAEGLLSSAHARILCIGNPVRRAGAYYQAHLDPSWTQLHISAWEHPNVVHKRLIYTAAVAPEWPAERREAWGEQHPLYLSRVVGQFPDQGEDTLIPLSWIEAAVERRVDTAGRVAMGCDVAYQGTDETVLVLLTGRRAEVVEAYAGKDPTETTGRLKRWLNMVDAVGVDDVGVGGAVFAGLEKAAIAGGSPGKVMGFGAGRRARVKGDFANLGTEAMWALREAFREGYEHPEDPSVGISIPDDPVLRSQLASREYEITEEGRILLKSKKALRKQGDPSPDRADALAIAWWAANRARPVVEVGRIIR